MAFWGLCAGRGYDSEGDTTVSVLDRVIKEELFDDSVGVGLGVGWFKRKHVRPRRENNQRNQHGLQFTERNADIV